MAHGTSEMRVLRIRARRANLLLLAQGISKGLLLHISFRDRAATIRAKAKGDHHRVGDTSGLQARQGREHVSIAISLDP